MIWLSFDWWLAHCSIYFQSDVSKILINGSGDDERCLQWQIASFSKLFWVSCLWQFINLVSAATDSIIKIPFCLLKSTEHIEALSSYTVSYSLYSSIQPTLLLYFCVLVEIFKKRHSYSTMQLFSTLRSCMGMNQTLNPEFKCQENIHFTELRDQLKHNAWLLTFWSSFVTNEWHWEYMEGTVIASLLNT